MANTWSHEQLRQLGHDEELRIGAYRDDGSPRSSVPVWSVVSDDAVYVRSWYRREGGWNDTASRSGRAHVVVDDVRLDVEVHDVGAADAGLRREVDDAYRRKYGAGAGSMVTDDAAATTLRLIPDA